ncbi:MAG: S41 family peptidase [Bacteroidales bacterium]|nr:S41 family peptidase [Bacteroidales bacterium]
MLPIFQSFYSCKEDIIEDPEVGYISSDIKWIYKNMNESYLWQDEIKEITKYDTSSDAEDFFSQLISKNETKKQAVGLFSNGDTLFAEYHYSYMEENPNYTKSSEGTINTYGIDYLLYGVKDSNPTQYLARVLYVYPNSPAESAGVRRGMWILDVNGEKLSASNYKILETGGATVWNIYYGDLKIGEPNFTANIEASEYIENTPIIAHKILDNGSSHKVGYIAYNHFSTGAGGFDDKSWDNNLKDVFTDFKYQGVNELVIDLRYNLGGYLSCAQLLASLVIPNDKFNEVFCRLTYNESQKKKNTAVYFDNSVRNTSNLNLSRVYILTGEWTASASEAVLNGLKGSGIMSDVIQIGYTTEGKNLASEEIKDNNYKWILHPIMAYVANKDYYGNYANGIVPEEKFFIDETDTKVHQKALCDLGDENELLLNMALLDMGYLDSSSDNGSETKAISVSNNANMFPVYNSVSKRRVKGTIIGF